MAEIWTLKAILRTGFLLIDENYELRMQGNDYEPGLIGYPISSDTHIHFSQPRRVQDPGWSGWDIILVLWVINSVTYFMQPFCTSAPELKAWKAGP